METQLFYLGNHVIEHENWLTRGLNAGTQLMLGGKTYSVTTDAVGNVIKHNDLSAYESTAEKIVRFALAIFMIITILPTVVGIIMKIVTKTDKKMKIFKVLQERIPPPMPALDPKVVVSMRGLAKKPNIVMEDEELSKNVKSFSQPKIEEILAHFRAIEIEEAGFVSNEALVRMITLLQDKDDAGIDEFLESLNLGLPLNKQKMLISSFLEVYYRQQLVKFINQIKTLFPRWNKLPERFEGEHNIHTISFDELNHLSDSSRSADELDHINEIRVVKQIVHICSALSVPAQRAAGQTIADYDPVNGYAYTREIRENLLKIAYLFSLENEEGSPEIDREFQKTIAINIGHCQGVCTETWDETIRQSFQKAQTRNGTGENIIFAWLKEMKENILLGYFQSRGVDQWHVINYVKEMYGEQLGFERPSRDQHRRLISVPANIVFSVLRERFTKTRIIESVRNALNNPHTEGIDRRGPSISRLMYEAIFDRIDDDDNPSVDPVAEYLENAFINVPPSEPAKLTHKDIEDLLVYIGIFGDDPIRIPQDPSEHEEAPRQDDVRGFAPVGMVQHEHGLRAPLMG